MESPVSCSLGLSQQAKLPRGWEYSMQRANEHPIELLYDVFFLLLPSRVPARVAA